MCSIGFKGILIITLPSRDISEFFRKECLTSMDKELIARPGLPRLEAMSSQIQEEACIRSNLILTRISTKLLFNSHM